MGGHTDPFSQGSHLGVGCGVPWAGLGWTNAVNPGPQRPAQQSLGCRFCRPRPCWFMLYRHILPLRNRTGVRNRPGRGTGRMARALFGSKLHAAGRNNLIITLFAQSTTSFTLTPTSQGRFCSTSISQVWKLRPRQVEQLAQGCRDAEAASEFERCQPIPKPATRRANVGMLGMVRSEQ